MTFVYLKQKLTEELTVLLAQVLEAQTEANNLQTDLGGAGNKKKRKLPAWATTVRIAKSRDTTPELEVPCDCGEMRLKSESAACKALDCGKSICPHCQVQCDDCSGFFCSYHMSDMENNRWRDVCGDCLNPWREFEDSL